MSELRIPPSSPEAEQSVLGGLLLDNDALSRFRLSADDFYSFQHRTIFDAIVGLLCEGKPADVVTVTGYGGKAIPLHRVAAAAWQALVRAARANGIADPVLLPVSGYRSPERQAQLWRDALQKYGSPEEARKWVAPPGSSAHQTGRAIDFYLGGQNGSGNVAQLRQLPAYHWMVANAVRFGFYPYEREPWHWEYNPPAR